MTRRNLFKGYFALRWEVLERDGFTCVYCGQHAPNVKLEVDHQIPVEDGGSDSKDNLVTACFACNRGKSSLRIRNKWLVRRTIAPGIPLDHNKTPSATEKIQHLLTECPNGIHRADIAERTSTPLATVSVILSRLRKTNHARVVNHLWSTPKIA